MSTYNPGVVIQRKDVEDLAKIRVDDFNVAELLLQVIQQLRIVSLKLDCLQPNEEIIDIIDDIELDTLSQ